MNKSLYIVAFSLAFATTGIAQNNEGQDKVIDLGTQTTTELRKTQAVSTIYSDELDKNATTSPYNAIYGLLPGLSVMQNTSWGTDKSRLNVRGRGSLNGDTPLFVVDGFARPLEYINLSEIESISVLKDGAATALWGGRGANGVVLITTKRGMYSKKEIKVDYKFGLGLPVNQPEFADAYTYAKARNEALRYDGLQPDMDEASFLSGGNSDLYPNVDWQKEMEQQALRTEIGVNVSGGGKTNQYYFSAGYLDDKGIALESGYQRFNLRSNISSEITRWLRGGVNMSYAHSVQNYPVSSDTKTSNVINAGRLMADFYPMYEMNVDGTYKLDSEGHRIYDFGSYRPSGSMANWNLPATLPNDKSERMRDEFSGRTFLEVTPVEGLKFKTSFNFDLTDYNTLDYTNPKIGPAVNTGGGASRSYTRTFSWTWNNIVTYDKTLGEHHFNVLAGQEAYSYRYDVLQASRSNMAVPDMPELAVGSLVTAGTGYRIDYSLLGYLVSGQYDYRNKYFFSASYRRDGSSRFAPDTRWGNFWSLGASWRVDREEFMQNTADWLSALTLKASYGAQGNDNLGTYYASSGLYSIVSQAGENALVSDRLATPDLKWETNLNLNVGIDFSLFNNRFSGSFDFFQRRSKDLLYSRPLATSLGYTSMDENIGALKNTGFEIDLKGTLIHTRDFMWRMGLNLTHYKNVVTELPLDDMPVTGVTRLKVGRSVYDFYLREWAGVDPANGDPLWYKNVKDAQGNITGRTTTNDYAQADYYYVDKSSLPKVYGGFNTAFAYKGFELSAIFAYSIGGYIVDRDVTMLWSNGSNPGRAWSTEILKRWTPENRDTDVPALRTVSNNWNSNSTRNLFNNSYLRMKNITLSYDFPQPLIKKVSLNSLQLFVQADNLLTFSKNQGLDPEQGITGLTYYRYPAMRSISGGINVSF